MVAWCRVGHWERVLCAGVGHPNAGLVGRVSVASVGECRPERRGTAGRGTQLLQHLSLRREPPGCWLFLPWRAGHCPRWPQRPPRQRVWPICCAHHWVLIGVLALIPEGQALDESPRQPFPLCVHPWAVQQESLL